MLKIDKIIENGTAKFMLAGRLDTTTAPEFEKELKESLEGVSDLTLDLSDLAYISSAGLRLVLSAQKIMIKQGSMKIRNVQENVKEIFEITGFTDIMDIE